jgi:hypothetical protein
LDEEFGLKYAEYEKEKEFELKDLENELEEELSIDIETDEQLVKYNTQMNIQNTKATVILTHNSISVTNGCIEREKGGN